MKKIGVVGAGLMGLGIAAVFCKHNYPVYIYEAIEEQRNTIKERLASILEDDGLNVELSKNVHILSSYAEFPEDLYIVFEAGPEYLEIKQKIFQSLVEVTSKATILASNTSVIPITSIAEGVSSSERSRVIGAHWWNPAHLTPLVEVIRTKYARDEALKNTYELLDTVGKKPVYVDKDVAGFIGNRLQNAMWREAHALISANVCTPEAIDEVVKNSFGMRLPALGPIENADLIGLDLTLAIHNVVLKDLNNSTEPLTALKERVENNQLGVKSGQGFLSWTPEKKKEVEQRLNRHIRLMTKDEQ